MNPILLQKEIKSTVPICQNFMLSYEGTLSIVKNNDVKCSLFTLLTIAEV
jgi:hypothetical protein